MSDDLPIVEVFGPTIQGEGPYAGRLADFIRLGGCNLACTWCDTPYSWDGSRFDLRQEILAKSPAEVLTGLSAETSVTVITGGEPLLHSGSPAFIELLQKLSSLGKAIHMETNGTILPPLSVRELVSVFVVSPKLSNAGTAHRRDPAPASGWAEVARHREVHVKVVCRDAAEVAEAVRLASSLGIARDHIWVMPEARDERALALRWPIIVDAAIAHRINATTRLHLLAWGNERGR